MQYVITTIDPGKNSGGNKAKKDIDFFAEELENTGVLHVPIYSTKVQKLLFTRSKVTRIIKSHPAERYILQYPLSSLFVLHQILGCIRKYSNAEIDFIVHDVQGLQFDNQDMNAEVALLNSVDKLVVHNQSMEKWLRDNRVRTPMINLELFDYHNQAPMQKNLNYKATVCFPGNLAKSRFLTKLSLKHRIDIYGPNRLDSYPECVKYCGQYTPEELPKHLNENFGLIWDGNSIDTCSGTFGQYLKYNNPHKASLYLSTGIPVIIWKQAALAPLIKKYNMGICIDNLSNLDKCLDSINNQEYQVMKKNAEHFGMRLRKGYYTKHALKELVSD